MSLLIYSMYACEADLEHRNVSCGGTQDLMSELEASFLASSLGLFRAQAGIHSSRAVCAVPLSPWDLRSIVCDAVVHHFSGPVQTGHLFVHATNIG